MKKFTKPDLTKTKVALAQLNQTMRASNRTKFIVGISIILLMLLAIIAYLHHGKRATTASPTGTPSQPVRFVGPVSQDFGGKEIQSAISGEQQREDATAAHANDLAKQLASQQQTIANLQKSIKAMNEKLSTQAEQRQAPITVVHSRGALDGSPVGTVNGAGMNEEASLGEDGQGQRPAVPQPMPIVYQSLVNPTVITPKKKEPVWKTMVPSGTFAKVVLLNGADANAGTTGQKNTDSIVMRVLDDGVLPNGKHSSLNGCFITASIYGDVSSERGKLRTNMISCVRKDGKVLNVPVEGSVLSDSGFNGIRGNVIMRNGKILESAGLAGFISGLSKGIQNGQQTQSTSALGTTSTVSGSQIFGNAAAGASDSASSIIARYYIQLAEQYHPVIEIHAGTVGTVVFLKPFSLNDDQPIAGLSADAQKATASSNSTPSGAEQLLEKMTPQQKATMMRAIQQAKGVTSSTPLPTNAIVQPSTGVN